MLSLHSLETEIFSKDEKVMLLLYCINKSNSNSLLAYCIAHALEKNDEDGVIDLLKSVMADDETVISAIYGDLALKVVKSL